MDSRHDYPCRCACGATRFRITAAPLFRFFCHCSLCRRFNAADYADVLVYRSGDVERPAADNVNFETYRPPPNVQRGKCVHCEQPALEIFESPVLPKLVMVPASVCPGGAQLATPSAHCFYESRVRDIDDELPRYRGYWRSQLAFFRLLLAAARRPRATH